MQLRSKLKPKRGKRQHQIEDVVETEGHASGLDKTMSSISKHVRANSKAAHFGEQPHMIQESSVSIRPSLKTPLPLGVDNTPKGSLKHHDNSFSVMQLKRQKQSALVKEASRGALTIMNVTFNDQSPRHGKSKERDVSVGKL